MDRIIEKTHRMKLAIMQPYFFPYIGYFQLIHSVDKFVLYDDVAFIKQGWINRNHILLNGKKHLLTVPVKDISSFSLINELYVSDKPFHWERKLLNTVKQAYSKAPFFSEVIVWIEKIIAGSTGERISEIAAQSIIAVLRYLEVEKEIVLSSSIYQNRQLEPEARIINICKKENAEIYINPIGGMELYSQEHFIAEQKKLFFLKPALLPYRQFNNDFIAGLSIIDVLMFNNKEQVKELLTNYELV